MQLSDQIFEITNKGLDIITFYYPEFLRVLDKSLKKVKLRTNEKNASANLHQLDNGIWVVTDFGGDQVSRNGIQVAMKEEGVSYKEALKILAERYLKQDFVFLKPTINKTEVVKEKVGTVEFVFKDFSEAELKILGKKVTSSHCKEFHLKSISSYTRFSKDYTITKTSTDHYPIFAFDFGTWQKIYEPNADKKYRFSYAGEKPKKYLHGLELLQKKYKENKKKVEDDEGWSIEDIDGELTEIDSDPRLSAVYICSGGTDGLNIRSFNRYPIWTNSESDHIDYDDYKLLKTYVKNIYYVADLDTTGLEQASALGMKFLDIKIIHLPDYLKQFKDKRNNPCKDFKDYVDKIYKPTDPTEFERKLEKIEENAMTMQFWSEHKDKKGKVTYQISNTKLYNFLSVNGFAIFINKTSANDYRFIRKEGNIINELNAREVESFIHNFLEDRQMSLGLRDYVYRSPQLKELSLCKIKSIDIDFSNNDKNTQYFFFNKVIWKVTKDEIIEYKHGEIEKYVWRDKLIDFKPTKKEDQFKIFINDAGDLDIEVFEKNNYYLNYLINGSRIHWRKELEYSFEGRDKEYSEYIKSNKFNISGSNLTLEEIKEQKRHLINKIFAIGYLMHSYKNPTKGWSVFVMDNKLSETGESNGGSGKSLGFGSFQHMGKRRVFIKGRDPKALQSEFLYSEVTDNTDYVFIDDADQYFKFGEIFSELTNSMKINVKNSNQFELEYKNSPKFIITSNHSMKDDDGSTARRVLYVAYSDYYHDNVRGEYNEIRKVADDFDGRIMYDEFTPEEWNLYYNFMAQCLKFYLTQSEMIQPPMSNLVIRKLQAEMGDAFESWADVFFATIDADIYGNEIGKRHLDKYISKKVAFENFKETTKNNTWSTSKFKKGLIAYCDLKGYVFNPSDILKQEKRIIKNVNGVAQEMFYIRTKPIEESGIITDITEYNDESTIFDR